MCLSESLALCSLAGCCLNQCERLLSRRVLLLHYARFDQLNGNKVCRWITNGIALFHVSNRRRKTYSAAFFVLINVCEIRILSESMMSDLVFEVIPVRKYLLSQTNRDGVITVTCRKIIQYNHQSLSLLFCLAPQSQL